MLSLITLCLFGQDTTLVSDTTIVDTTSTGLSNLFSNLNPITIISLILTALLFIVASVFGTKYYQKKQVLIQLLQAIIDAVKDDKVTKQELNKILQIYKSL